MQAMLVNIIHCDLISKGASVGKKVRWQQEGAYDVDAQEVAEYAQQLVKDLREAGVDKVVVESDEDHESTTEEDIWGEGASESKSVNQESEGVQDKGEEEEYIYEYSQKHWGRNEVGQKDHKGQGWSLEDSQVDEA